MKTKRILYIRITCNNIYVFSHLDGFFFYLHYCLFKINEKKRSIVDFFFFMLYQNRIEPWPPNRGTYRTVTSTSTEPWLSFPFSLSLGAISISLRCIVGRLCHCIKPLRWAHLSSILHELQDVVVSKVCMRNSWKLLFPLSGQMFDLLRENEREEVGVKNKSEDLFA